MSLSLPTNWTACSGAERRPADGDLTYSRAEAGRILLAATGRQGITPDDRAYLMRLVASRTGIPQPDAERRVGDAIAGATTAVQKARRSAVILGFSRAVAFAGWGCRRVVHLVCRRALPGRRFSIFGLALAAARLSLRPLASGLPPFRSAD
jgi:hypothetical protein